MNAFVHNLRKKTGVLALALLATLAACGFNIFTDQDDVNLGRQLDEQIRSSPGEYPILRGRPDVKQYVEGIVRTVLASPEVKKKDIYPYTVEIINDDKTINAFCTPGGYIYVYTGLLKFLDNEASLAGVLGHEIAHAELRHATKRITAAYGVQIALAVALGENPTLLEQIASNLFVNLGFLKNSRDDEEESDNASMLYLRSTPYYPGAIRYFFDKVLAQKGRRGTALERLLSTHPLPRDRVENVENTMKKWNVPPPSEANLFTARYRKFKRNLP